MDAILDVLGLEGIADPLILPVGRSVSPPENRRLRSETSRKVLQFYDLGHGIDISEADPIGTCDSPEFSEHGRIG